MSKVNYEKTFSILSHNLELFIEEIKKKKSTQMATDQWTVKDLLSHLVFWHENYAANYDALTKNIEPPLLDGPSYKLNLAGVASLKKCSMKELINRLHKAQNSLYKSIVEEGLSKMTYKKDGRVYTTLEFLTVIARHFATHTKQVKKAK